MRSDPLPGQDAADIAGTERRIDPRVEVALEIEVVPAVQDGTGPLRMRSHNLSCGGVLCVSPAPLDGNSLVSCTIRLPEGESWPGEVHTDAIVLRSRRARETREGEEIWVVALYFIDMESTDQEALKRFVFETLRRLGPERAESG